MPSSTWGNSSVPSSHQNRNVARANAITIQVKRPAQRSAMACTGALRAWACSTRAITRASADSDPGRNTLRSSGACKLRLPAASSSPLATLRGKGSPVRLDSSSDELPSITTPSTGKRSPGSTRR